MNVLTRKALADVTQRKGRTILISFSILISIMGLTAVNSANETIGGAFIYSHDQSSSPDMTFLAPQIDPSVLPGLTQLPNVAKVQLRLEYHSRWHTETGSSSATLQINGYPDIHNIQLGKFQLTSGRLPGIGEVIVDVSGSAPPPVRIGDSLTVDTSQGTARLNVVGLGLTQGWATTRGTAQILAYMDASALQKLDAPTTTKGKGSSGPQLDYVIMVKVTDIHQSQATFQTIESTLENAGVKVTDAGAYDTTSQASTVQAMLAVLELLTLVALLLTSLLVINTINTLITEQTRIIGIMKAIGGNRHRIMGSYLLTIGIYSLAGTLLGIPAGLFLGNQVATSAAVGLHIILGPVQISPWVIISGTLVGLLLPLLAALFPLWQGTRISVREAIAAYGVKVNTAKPRILVGRQWWVPQTILLGLRSTFLKPWRALLTVLALTLSCAVFLAVQITTTSIDYSLNQQVHSFNYDLLAQWGSIKFQAGIYQDLRQNVQILPNVERIEPRITESIQNPLGNFTLIGLEADTKIYQYHLLEGRWLADREQKAVVVSDLLAQALHLHLEEILELAEGNVLVQWQIVGIVHDLQTFGGSGTAYTTSENMNVNLLQRSPDSTLTLMVSSRDHTENGVNRLAQQVNETLNKLGIQAQVSTLQETIVQFQSINLIVYLLFYTIALIVGLVGLLGLFDTISTSVLERRLEIGILRSLGAMGWQVTTVFWIEGLALSLLAWGVGTLLGIPGAYGIIRLLSVSVIPLDFSLPPLLILTTLGFIVVGMTLATIMPVLNAGRVQLRQILRYE